MHVHSIALGTRAIAALLGIRAVAALLAFPAVGLLAAHSSWVHYSTRPSDRLYHSCLHGDEVLDWAFLPYSWIAQEGMLQ